MSLPNLFAFLNVEHGVIAALFALLGAVITQILNNRSKLAEIEGKHFSLAMEDAVAIRKELRHTVSRLEAELAHLNKTYMNDMTDMRTQHLKCQADISALNILIVDLKARAKV